MKKEIRKMHFYAILKIIIPIALMVLIIWMVSDLGDDVAAVVVSVCWGIGALIYIVSGIVMLKNGAKEAREYIKNYPGGEDALDEEYKRAQNFGRIRVGERHVFINASNDFYIFPLEDVQSVYALRFGHNPVKGRPGYYYVFIKSVKMDYRVKAYYAFKDSAMEVMEYLKACTGIEGEIREDEETEDEI